MRMQKTKNKLVIFLYTLMRDNVVPGEVEGILAQEAFQSDDECILSNGYLANHAKDIARRLEKSFQKCQDEETQQKIATLRDHEKRLWKCLKNILGPTYIGVVTHSRASDEARSESISGLENTLNWDEEVENEG